MLHKISKFPGLRPDPSWGAYSAPQTLYIVGDEGTYCPSPSPKTPPLLSAFWASGFGHTDRSFVTLPVKDKISPPPQKKSELTPLNAVEHKLHFFKTIIAAKY